MGHRYVKGSDCPTCPKCEKLRLAEHFVPGLSNPAKRALASLGIGSINDLAKHREADVMKAHGIGPSASPRMRAALKAAGLKFRK
jgi:predicted RecB family nuclease